MKRGFKRLFITLGVLIIAGGMGSVAYFRYEEKLQLAGGIPQFGRGKDQDVDTVTPVAVSRAERGSITESLVLNGEVIPVKVAGGKTQFCQCRWIRPRLTLLGGIDTQCCGDGAHPGLAFRPPGTAKTTSHDRHSHRS